ncbi:Trafficking protein particle complex subunit 31 [Taxawa tesnikishii (nom. ined.)]|nr:Trafficking protein particle complex subunit 31 [Dothideales sp. JES 119]
MLNSTQGSQGNAGMRECAPRADRSARRGDEALPETEQASPILSEAARTVAAATDLSPPASYAKTGLFRPLLAAVSNPIQSNSIQVQIQIQIQYSRATGFTHRQRLCSRNRPPDSHRQTPPLPTHHSDTLPGTAASDRKVHLYPLPPPAPYTPLRYPRSGKTIYDRNLNRAKTAELSLPSFAHLFNSLVSYHHARSPTVADLEARLASSGYPVGVKMLDLLLYRQPQRTVTRPTRLLDLLNFIHTQIWRSLFNRPADALQQSNEDKNWYMIIDNEPLVNTYISVPKEMSQLNCAAFVAGLIEGACDAAGFSTDGVGAHSIEGDELWPGKTVFLIKFKPEVAEREAALKSSAG